MSDQVAKFPRTYHPTLAWRIYLIGGGLALATGMSIGAWHVAARQDSGQASALIVTLLLLLAVAGGGLYTAYSVFRSKLVLYADRIEIREAFHTKTLVKAEILGWRIRRFELSFRLAAPAKKMVSTAMVYRVDEELAEWLDDIPNLDEAETEASIEEIHSSEEHGFTPEERSEAHRQYGRWAGGLTTVTWVAVAWSWVMPAPYALCLFVLAALPLAALRLAGASHGMVRLDPMPNDQHPSVAVPLLLPSLLLAARGVLDSATIDWLRTMPVAAAIAVFLWIAALRVDASIPRSSIRSWLLLLLLVAYGLGLVVFLEGTIFP